MTQIFVFGSNLAGRHGKGAARYARENHGAIYGQGKGIQGTSYAIPTKGYGLEPLSLVEIEHWVKEFLKYAEEHPEDTFHVTAIGTGLAGYTPEEIAPFFIGCTGNVLLPTVFKEVLDNAQSEV